jgi:hypothetical protein
MKEYKCVEVKHHSEIGKVIEKPRKMTGIYNNYKAAGFKPTTKEKIISLRLLAESPLQAPEVRQYRFDT